MSEQGQVRLSVVTPSYNQNRFIEQTILSVKGQNCPGVEHVVMDGGSTDGTVETLERYAGSYNLQWTSEPDKGQSDALNKGLSLSRGRLIGWLNSDDIYLPDALVKVTRYFDAHPETDWLYGDGCIIDEDSRLLAPSKGRPYDLEAFLRDGQFICQPAAFFRRRALEAAGPLDPALHFGMDYDLFIRLGLRCAAGYLPETLAAFRITDAAKSLDKSAQFVADLLRALDKIFALPDLPRRVAALKEAAYAHAYLEGGIQFFEIGRFAEARTHLQRSLARRRRPFARRTILATVLWLESLLRMHWFVPMTCRKLLRDSRRRAETERLPSLAWQP